MNFEQVKSQKLYEKVADQLKGMIINGEIKPGQKLPSVRELAELLQVGRSAVREALSALRAMGLVEMKQGEGTFVKNVSESDLLSFDVSSLLVNIEQVNSLLEVRKILEVSSAELAAIRRSDDDLKALESALEEMEQDLISGQLSDDADWKFHYAIASSTQNKMLVHVIESISDTMKKHVKTNREILFSLPEKPTELIEEHRKVYHAIKANDSLSAKNLMWDHLTGVEEELTELLKEK